MNTDLHNHSPKQDEPWRLTVYGVRGSMPLMNSRFMRYGGNTSCYLLECGETLILDAGTGILQINDEILEGRRLHILLSHYHLDHIQGLLGFRPLFEENREIHFYGENNVRKQLECLFASPLWPVSVSDFKARIVYHTVDVKSMPAFIIETYDAEGNRSADRDIFVFVCHLSHPGGSLGYRICRGEKSLIYATDCELESQDLAAFRAFVKNADFGIFDAAYLPGKEIKGYGHSSWIQVMETLKNEQVGTQLYSHYSTELTDEMLDLEQRIGGEQDRIQFARENSSYCF